MEELILKGTKEEIINNLERVKRAIETGYLCGELTRDGWWDLSEEKEEKDMREIIKDILEKAECEDIDEEVIDNHLFSLGMRVNQKVILRD